MRGCLTAAVILLAVLAAAGLLSAPPWTGEETPSAAAPAAASPSGTPRLAAPLPPRGATASDEASQAAERESRPIPPRFRLVAVDATSGREVACTWIGRRSPRELPQAPHPYGPEVLQAACERWESEFLPSHESASVPAVSPRHPGWIDADLVIRPPPGYAAADDAVHVEALAARDVREILAVVPLWPETVMDLHVLDGTGALVEGARLTSLQVAGRTCRPIVEDQRRGAMRVRGIPALVGEPVEVQVECPPAETTLSGTSAVPAEPWRPWLLELRHLPPGWIFYNDGGADPVPTENHFPSPRDLAPEATAGQVRLRVLDRCGMPRRAWILDESGAHRATTDARGEASVGGLAAGKRTMRVLAFGVLPWSTTVRIGTEQESLLVLQEPEGAWLDVLVIDGEDRPRPSSRIDLPGRGVLDVVGDVQRADTFTDHLGRRSFARVEPGEATVVATWGSRRGEAKVVLRDGERASVRVVVR